MKEKIKQIQKLRVKLSDLRFQIRDRVLEVAKRYIVAAHPTNRGYGYPTVTDADFKWTIDSRDVNVTWYEFWNYGGEDEGEFSFPVEYLWDDVALVAYEELRKKEKENVKKQRQENERQKEIKQLQKLQEKYPGGFPGHRGWSSG